LASLTTDEKEPSVVKIFPSAIGIIPDRGNARRIQTLP